MGILAKYLVGALEALTLKEKKHIFTKLGRSLVVGTSRAYPEHVLYWDEQIHTWMRLSSPIRPSKETVDIYRASIREQLSQNNERDKTRILILGSTPELRDLVAEEAPLATVYLADTSYKMPAAMLNLTRFVDPLKERWIRCDWLDLPFENGYFDIILGDLVLQQVPPNLELSFLEKLRVHTNSRGRVVVRLNHIDPVPEEMSIDEMVAEVMQQKYSEREKASMIRFRILWQFTNRPNRTFNRQRVAEEFSAFMKRTQHSDAMLKNIEQSFVFYKDSNRTWAPPTEEQLDLLVSKKLSIGSKQYAQDHALARNFPVYTLLPK